ncbi:MAG: class I SAM-dependent methyltransferase [Xanthomonadales bacterium]|nr:class I SAM-dependent methyltransferase [Xanthomonadales bacterium]
MSRFATRLARGARRLWMKYAMRGVGGADAWQRLDHAYAVPDPWHMDSALEQARFAQTNALIAATFGRVGSILELGCGEGHQTRWLREVADQVCGIDVSARAIERARLRVPEADFAVADIHGQPFGDQPGRFDLVVACEVLYYIKDIPATLTRMSELGRDCLATFYAPALSRVGPHLAAIPDLHKDWMQHNGVTWLVCWWRNP